MVRAALRWTLRGIQGALALAALAALCAWPWSYGHPGELVGERWAVESGRVESITLRGGFKDGRVIIDWYRSTLQDWLQELGRQRAAEAGSGWARGFMFGVPEIGPPDFSTSWGPIGWEFRKDNNKFASSAYRALTFPLWLLSLLAGAWPLASLALFLRRRRRLRRRARIGLCRACEYDLRATPSPGGATLSVCPECGRAAGAETRSPKPEIRIKHEGGKPE